MFKKTIEFVKVHVHEDYKNWNLDKVIVAWGFEWAIKNKFEVYPTSTYIRNEFLDRNP